MSPMYSNSKWTETMKSVIVVVLMGIICRYTENMEKINECDETDD
jgi:hypothetical protein